MRKLHGQPVDRWVLAFAAMLALAGVAWAADLGFSKGMKPLSAHFVASQQCAQCHADKVAEWQDSRHHHAWTNALMQAGYAVEPMPVCAQCHAPYPEQLAEINANRDHYRSVGKPFAIPALPEPKASEGITCAVCHVRNGTVLGPTGNGGGAHPAEAEPTLKDPSFCANCHEFPFIEVHDGEVRVSEMPIQSTYTEWQESGFSETCQDCHMPEGRHVFRGSHDLEFLRNSLRVGMEKGAFVLESVGVGHHLPTGDLYRHLTLEVLEKDTWKEIYSVGRLYDLAFEEGVPSLVMTADTSLRPGVPVRVPYKNAERAQWRVRYHYASKRDEARGLVPWPELVVVVAESATRR